MVSVLVGSFNILNTCTNYQGRRPYITSAIHDMNRDILGIQEVNIAGNTEIILPEIYKTEYVSQPEPLILPLPDFKIDGNALLIKHDIEILETHSLIYEGKQRAAQFIKLRKAGVVFVMANTHLDHISDETRTKQVTEFLQFSQQFKEFPMICTGDFNFIPESEPYLLMTQEFRSAYLESNGKEADRTFPTDLEGIPEYGFMAIDYIWIRGLVRAKSAQVFLRCGHESIWASDHFPVVAELEILNDN